MNAWRVTIRGIAAECKPLPGPARLRAGASDPIRSISHLSPMKHLHHAALCAALLTPMCGLAADTINALGQCLSDSTSGKDRKDLAKWIFVSMSAHPEIRQLGAASPEAADATQRTMGALVTRLMAENCPKEMRAAVKADGPNGAKAAFEYLGKIAMQELMTNTQVNESIGGFEKYLDKARVEKVLKSE